jgi:hypothetical protein
VTVLILVYVSWLAWLLSAEQKLKKLFLKIGVRSLRRITITGPCVLESSWWNSGVKNPSTYNSERYSESSTYT